MVSLKFPNASFSKCQRSFPVFFILLVLVLPAKNFYAQNDSLLFFQSNSYGVQMWHPNEFKTHGIKSREVYNYKMSIWGRLLNKKELLFSQFYDEAQNKTHGVMFSEFTYHEKYFIYYERYEIYFDSIGNTIKQTSEKLEKHPELEGDFKIFSFKVDETDLTYDSLNRLSLRIDITRDFDFKINVNSNDTIDFKVKEAKVYSRYLYSSKNKLLRKYTTIDSSMIFLVDVGLLDSIFESDCCKKIDSRSKYYLREKWSYDENGNLSEWISYSDNYRTIKKRSYLFDNSSRIILRIDSIIPFRQEFFQWDYSKAYEYNDSGYILITNNNVDGPFNDHGVRTDTTFYGSDGNPIKSYILDRYDSSYCDYFKIYKDRNQNFKKIVWKHKGKLFFKDKYFYNKQGLISKSKSHYKKRKNYIHPYYNSKIKYVYK